MKNYFLVFFIYVLIYEYIFYVILDYLKMIVCNFSFINVDFFYVIFEFESVIRWF